jgi:hypothetical protein
VDGLGFEPSSAAGQAMRPKVCCMPVVEGSTTVFPIPMGRYLVEACTRTSTGRNHRQKHSRENRRGSLLPEAHPQPSTLNPQPSTLPEAHPLGSGCATRANPDSQSIVARSGTLLSPAA